MEATDMHRFLLQVAVYLCVHEPVQCVAEFRELPSYGVRSAIRCISKAARCRRRRCRLRVENVCSKFVKENKNCVLHIARCGV